MDDVNSQYGNGNGMLGMAEVQALCAYSMLTACILLVGSMASVL